MKTQVTRKVVLMCSAVLLGIAVCMSFWLFLREHKARNSLTNSELKTERINTAPAKQNTNENQGDESRRKAPAGRDIAFHLLTLEERAERVTQMAKSNRMAMFSEEELVRPDIQKRINVYDSPEFLEMVKEHMESGSFSRRKFWKIFESQGVPIYWGVHTQLFREVFPTGEPEDYEPEMRLELAKLFLAAEPVDPADSRAVLRQGLAVYAKFIKEGDKTFPWLAGRFDIDWDGAILGNTENNPAFEWVKDVQRNAANIVAGAEAAGDPGPDTDSLASSWDLSSVMESPPASHSETEVPTTPDTSGSVLMTDAEIEAAIEKSLTRQTPDILTNQQPDTPIEIQSNLETTLKSQFSSERFERAMSTLEQYGPEEGLRRLRENDPEVASQIEQHRNRFRSGDSDKSEEVSK